MKKISVILMVSICINILTASTIKFKAQWYPQAQFAGYIMAVEKGFFEELDLDVELLFSTGNDDSVTELKAEDIQYCSLWLSEAISKNEGLELVNILQVLQKSSLMLISLEENNIMTPNDLNGKKIRLWGGNFAIPFKAFINKYNLDFEEVSGSYNIDLFLSGACDVTAAMYYNEYNKLFLAGINYDEMNTIQFSEDDDLNFPEDGIYVTSRYFKNNRDEVNKMIKAITRGWQYANENQDEAVQTILTYCDKWKLKTNYSEQKWMLEKILEASYIGNDFGRLKKDKFQQVQEELLKQKIIRNKTAFSDFYIGAENEKN